MNGKTYRELYDIAVELTGSKFDAGQLFTHITAKRAQHLPFIGDKPAPPDAERLLRKMCDQRRSGVPLQYLLGEWEFYGLPLKVGRGVLIPRADTELLVDCALELMKEIKRPEILDLCAGTGCVAIAIAAHRKDANVTALEVSDTAFDYLTKNIALNSSGVYAVKEDLGVYRHLYPLDIITCNPPYIPAQTISSLQPEIWYEPRLALDGGKDGLDFYHAVSRLYKPQLRDGGWLCFEVGIGQSAQVAQIMEANGFTNIFTRDDLGGIPRVVGGAARCRI